MLADGYDCLLFDLDGVLYRGDAAVPGAPETLAELRRVGARPIFLTNNSARTPEQVAAKLRGLGIAADPDEVVTSALVTAELLSQRGGGRAFVVGGDGVRRALADAGIQVLEAEPERADLVVVGFDRHVTYERLKVACLLVQRGARLVATNADASYPAADGLWPGAGALLAVITTVTGVGPEVVGKPSAPLFEAALRRGGGRAPLVIGDRLDTDIEGAARLGWDSMLVLTGVSSRREAETPWPRPTFVVDDVRALLGRADGRGAARPGRAGRRSSILALGGAMRRPNEDTERGAMEMGVDEVRKYMEAAMGKLSAAKAQELARSMVKGEGREQVSKTAKDLLEWSNKNRERLADLIRSEVRSQVKTFGVATREDVDALRKRVRDLERAGVDRAPTKKSTANRSTAKRVTPKKKSTKPSAGGTEN